MSHADLQKIRNEKNTQERSACRVFHKDGQRENELYFHIQKQYFSASVRQNKIRFLLRY